MKVLKKNLFFLLSILLLCSIVSCSKKSQKPAPSSEHQPKPLPKVVKAIEKNALDIMNQADHIPYFNRSIQQKEQIGKEKEQKEMQKIALANDTKPPKSESSKEAPKKPEPMTLDESILSEILKNEATENKSSQTPPKDINEIWKKINTSIIHIHDQWNTLEPLLLKASVPSDTISSFEDTLDTLTTYGMEKNTLLTLTTSNDLTAYLSKFMPYFKKETSPSIYTLKYLTRNVVLQAGIKDYTQAQNTLAKIKEQSQTLKLELLEKKATTISEQFNASIDNLQKALNKQNINLIKIKASIVMKNIIQIMDELTKM